MDHNTRLQRISKFANCIVHDVNALSGEDICNSELKAVDLEEIDNDPIAEELSELRNKVRLLEQDMSLQAQAIAGLRKAITNLHSGPPK